MDTENIITDYIVLPSDRTQAELLARYHYYRTEQHRCDDEGKEVSAECYSVMADRISEVCRMIGLAIICRKGMHYFIKAN